MYLIEQVINIMEYRGHSDDTIEQQKLEIMELEKMIEHVNENDGIYQMLEQSDKQLLNKIIEQYESYKHESNKEISQKQSFKESLRKGVPDLEQQKENSINFLNQQEEENKHNDSKDKIVRLDDSLII